MTATKGLAQSVWCMLGIVVLSSLFIGINSHSQMRFIISFNGPAMKFQGRHLLRILR